MEIVLLRHGKPKLDTAGRVSAAEFGEWVSAYDMAGIDAGYGPSDGTILRAGRCSFTVCSHLPRSIESARFLNIHSPDLVSPQFRECEMPYGNWAYPRLSKLSWSIIFRLLQLGGYSSNSESYRDIKERSRQCTMQLVELAQAHGSVLFVGHGTLIWFMHRHLVSMGWYGPQKSAKQHWEFGEYSYSD